MLNPTPNGTLPLTFPYSDTSPSHDEAQTSSPIRATRNVLDTTKLWPNGSTLKIALYDANEADTSLIKDAINKWQPYVNLKFEFVSGGEGDIRIRLSHRVNGGFTVPGTDAKNIPLGQPTMVVQSDTQSARFPFVVTHEFGHALGHCMRTSIPTQTSLMTRKKPTATSPITGAGRRKTCSTTYTRFLLRTRTDTCRTTDAQ